MSHKELFCIIHIDRKAITTAGRIPVCDVCHNIYAREGEKYLPEQDRKFYNKLKRLNKWRNK